MISGEKNFDIVAFENFSVNDLLGGPAKCPPGVIPFCRTHNRPATHFDKQGRLQCDPRKGGIMLPCLIELRKSAIDEARTPSIRENLSTKNFSDSSEARGDYWMIWKTFLL